MTKSDYLKHLYNTAVGNQTAKERDQNDLDLFIKALDVLKKSVDDPTTVGLTNPLLLGMIQAPATQSFMEFQAAEKDRQAALEAQTAQDVQTAQAVQAELDAQAARDTHTIQGVQGTGELDLDEQDEANMQQALLLSRQDAQAHAQAQDADPTASSSATPGRTIEEEIDFELQLGRDFQREAACLEQKMTTARLTTDELGRLRKLSHLRKVNRDRVVELSSATSDAASSGYSQNAGKS